VHADTLFWRFVLGLFTIMVLYGMGMTFVLISGNNTIGLRMISGFASMFAGVLGLGSGYILAQRAKQDKAEERRPDDSS